MHALALEIECERRACQAHDLIHPELGRGNTNIVEASHHILTKFQSKDQNLQRLHYVMSTNLGLLQANMTYNMWWKRGPQYHWILELYNRLGLLVFENTWKYLQHENESRMQVLLKQKIEEAKEKQTAYKAKRASDLDSRKKWVKQQVIRHTYGSDEEEDDKTSSKRVESSDFDQHVFTSSKAKVCKCGSTTLFRTTHSQCLLNRTMKNTFSSSLHDSDSDINEPFSESESE